MNLDESPPYARHQSILSPATARFSIPDSILWRGYAELNRTTLTAQKVAPLSVLVVAGIASLCAWNPMVRMPMHNTHETRFQTPLCVGFERWSSHLAYGCTRKATSITFIVRRLTTNTPNNLAADSGTYGIQRCLWISFSCITAQTTALISRLCGFEGLPLQEQENILNPSSTSEIWSAIHSQTYADYAAPVCTTSILAYMAVRTSEMIYSLHRCPVCMSLLYEDLCRIYLPAYLQAGHIGDSVIRKQVWSRKPSESIGSQERDLPFICLLAPLQLNGQHYDWKCNEYERDDVRNVPLRLP
ncbi:hypothetical protein OE88DRAFT_1542629 [Heliocybe sulcata]|uniref:Uncharacterized protein n=1 Tax=Heliocybe sulcata TaxID=5364 RepID=A0A5C3NBZ4_9AGAM|nr:hypothetical protein OE88DRAFT_1542629 [Heliocybe sulcata]